MIFRKDFARNIHIKIELVSENVISRTKVKLPDEYSKISMEFIVGFDDFREDSVKWNARGLKGISIFSGNSLIIEMAGSGEIYESPTLSYDRTRLIFPRKVNTQHPLLEEILNNLNTSLTEHLKILNVNDYSIPPERASDIVNTVIYQTVFTEEGLLKGTFDFRTAWYKLYDHWMGVDITLRERCKHILVLFMEPFFDKFRDQINSQRSPVEVCDDFVYYELNFISQGQTVTTELASNADFFREFESLSIVKEEFARLSPLLDLIEECLMDYYSILYDIFAEVDNEISQTIYMGPLRRIPTRLQRHRGDLYDEESKTWDMLEYDDKIRDKVNYWLSDRLNMKYLVETRKYFSGKSLKKYVEAHERQATYTAMTLLSGAFFRYLRELGVDEDTRRSLGDKLKHQAYIARNSNKGHDSLDLELFPDEIRKDPDMYASIYEGADPEHTVEYNAKSEPGTLSTESLAKARSFWYVEQLISLVKSEDIEPDTVDITLHDIENNVDLGLKDVGVGVSQLLPIIVASVANNGSNILIEQPELHVHPALQADIGDLFIEGMNINKNSYLIETHSEHLILRMLRRIRETTRNEGIEESLKLLTAELGVYYISPDESGSKVIQVELTEDGDFKGYWPRGFFADRSKELF